jgi:hypothetical protein
MKILLLQNKRKPEPKIQAFYLLNTLFLIGFLFLSHAGMGQSSPFTFSGYLEAYYSFDFNNPANKLRPDFLYNFKRHNEFNINLGLISAKYQKDKIRSTTTLMIGNYSQYNLADEPQWAQFVYEASVGVKLSDKTWLDIGIMPSHIGFETAIGADNWHLSRSILAENSPYYLAGARLEKTINDKTDFTLWIANGWQKIQVEDNTVALSLGTKIHRKINSNLSVDYANFLVNDNPYSLWMPRFFNNFFFTYTSGDWGFIGGVDVGIERAFQSNRNWQGYTFSTRKKIADAWHMALRGEYYSDPNAIILNEGMKITGISTNLDYQIQENALFRLEFRQFLNPDPLFTLPGGNFSIGNYALTSSLSVRF